MIDMDHFKEVNDSHGHAAGDHLLRSFAESVRITLRKTDLAFRYGGDEFVIALPQTTVAQAQQVVQKLRQAFAAIDFSDAIHALEHQPTLSVGVAERSVDTGVQTWSALARGRGCSPVRSQGGQPQLRPRLPPGQGGVIGSQKN